MKSCAHDADVEPYGARTVRRVQCSCSGLLDQFCSSAYVDLQVSRAAHDANSEHEGQRKGKMQEAGNALQYCALPRIINAVSSAQKAANRPKHSHSLGAPFRGPLWVTRPQR